MGRGVTEGSGAIRVAQCLRRGRDPSAPAGHLPVPGRIVTVHHNAAPALQIPLAPRADARA